MGRTTAKPGARDIAWDAIKLTLPACPKHSFEMIMFPNIYTIRSAMFNVKLLNKEGLYEFVISLFVEEHWVKPCNA